MTDPISDTPKRGHQDPGAGRREETHRPAPRPLWRTLVTAQESGLVVVIAIVMGLLTIFGGTKQQPVRVEIPPGAAVEEAVDGVIIVTTPQGQQRHFSQSGWRIRPAETDGGVKVAFGSRSVNKFFERENLVLLTNNASFIAVMAVGITAIIVLGGIDLSIGSIYALSALLGAGVLASLEAGALKSSSGGTLPVHIAFPIGILVCCIVGGAAGFFNGAMVVGLRVHPFIITLGTMAVYRGLVFVYSGGQTVSGLPDSIQTGFFKLQVAGVYPIPTLIMLVVAGAGVFVLSRTVLGRRIYAIGGNETAARYAGVPVGRVKIICYTVCGALAGLSACMYMGYFGAAENNAGQGYELQVIAAAVIGGASLSGGRGSALGAVLGAILVKLIDNAMVIRGVDQSYNQIIMGAAIILAVVVDQAKTRFVKA